ncbi:MAG: hypothetical protein Mars2KO_15670 [Maribacter sp.]
MRLFNPTLFLLVSLFVLNSCSKDSAVLEEVQQLEQEVNLTARSAAQKLYEEYYLASRSTTGDVAWSGDDTSCTAGEVPQATIDKILMRIAYFRQAVGLNNTISENSSKSEKAQDAALMMKSNGTLDHFPPNTWSCYTEAGKEGAGNSLLTQTRNAEAVDSYMRDAGASNGPVGHRRWLLWPRLQEIGIGNTDATNAIWVLGNSGTPPSDAPDFVSWPPKGYAPQQLVYPRWSFSIRDADFTETSITMRTPNNETIALSIEALDNAYGDRTIVWVPEINLGALDGDTSYTVALQNVGVDGEALDFEYEVILFDSND